MPSAAVRAVRHRRRSGARYERHRAGPARVVPGSWRDDFGGGAIGMRSTQPHSKKRAPPAWLLGLTNASFGFYTGFLVLSLPQALTARHVFETAIASTTAIVVSPTIYSFLLGPILDVRFSRRAYATALTIVSAAMLGVSVLSIESAFLLKVAATSPDEAT